MFEGGCLRGECLRGAVLREKGEEKGEEKGKHPQRKESSRTLLTLTGLT